MNNYFNNLLTEPLSGINQLYKFYKQIILYNYQTQHIWHSLFTAYYSELCLNESLQNDKYNVYLSQMIQHKHFSWSMLPFNTEQKEQYYNIINQCNQNDLVTIYINKLVCDKDLKVIYNKIIENKKQTLDAIDMEFKAKDDFNKYLENSITLNNLEDILTLNYDLTNQQLQKIFNILENEETLRNRIFFNPLINMRFKELLFEKFYSVPDLKAYETIFFCIINYKCNFRQKCFNYLIQNCAFSFWKQCLEFLFDDELEQIYNKFGKLIMIPINFNVFQEYCRIFRRFINNDIKWQLVNSLIQHNPYKINDMIELIDFDSQQLFKLKSIQCLNDL